MKFLKFAGIISLVTCFSLSVSSCSKDDDAPDSPNDSEVSDIDGTRVTRIDDCEIGYDSKGRPDRFIIDDDGTFFIDYSKGILTTNESAFDYKVKFNGKGFLTELNANWDFKGTEYGETYQSKGSGKITLSYDNSVLKGVKMNASSTEKYGNQSIESKSNMSADFKWNNGNLTEIKSKEEGTENGEKYTIDYIATIEYSNIKNTFRQFPMAIADETEILTPYFFGVGLFGNGPENLPSSLAYIEYEDEEEYQGSTNISFDLNANGSINKESTKYETWNYSYSNITRALSSAMEPKQVRPEMIRDLFKSRHSKRK